MTTQAPKVKKAWKGERRNGPAPARHVPWPEVFKHHISVVEGHTKMLEMIQKHTVPGTGNHDTITSMVNRAHEMMEQAKSSSRSFIPPAGQREAVPLGSGSNSMYPGYSPKDIVYGKASAEAGRAVGALKAQGKNWQSPAGGPEFKIGQAHGAKRSMIHEDTTDTAGADGTTSAQADPEEHTTTDGEPLFYIDTNPTPVDLDGGEGGRRKKSRKDQNIIVETEDISAEVEARLQAKAKSKTKDEKKRRRDSGGDETRSVKKAKKDKSKKREVESGEEGSGDADGSKKKRKRNKD